MTENMNHKMLAPLKPITINRISVTTNISAVPEPDKPETTRNKKEEGKEEAIPFEKWTQPSQLECYIQYLPFDPF